MLKKRRGRAGCDQGTSEKDELINAFVEEEEKGTKIPKFLDKVLEFLFVDRKRMVYQVTVRVVPVDINGRENPEEEIQRQLKIPKNQGHGDAEMQKFWENEKN